MKEPSMNIYSEKESENRRYIDVCFENGKIRMDEQDLAPGFESERCAYGIDPAPLKELWGVRGDKKLLQQIAQLYGNVHGFDQFTDFCTKQGLTYGYYSGWE